MLSPRWVVDQDQRVSRDPNRQDHLSLTSCWKTFTLAYDQPSVLLRAVISFPYRFLRPDVPGFWSPYAVVVTVSTLNWVMQKTVDKDETVGANVDHQWRKDHGRPPTLKSSMQ